MTLYTRPQLAVLIAVVAVAGVGLAAGHWRRLHPELTELLEAFDRASGPGNEVGRTSLAVPAPPPRLEVSAVPLDVNRASALDLARLPGVDPSLAAPFTAVDDLRRVRGLGRATLDRLRALVTTEGGTSSPGTVPSPRSRVSGPSE